MYRLSNFNIEVNLNNNETLLYNTLTTSLISIDKKQLAEIKSSYANEKDEHFGHLLEMGFITSEADNESDCLHNVRNSFIQNADSMESITIAPSTRCNARCYYCFEKGSQEHDMTLDVASKVVDLINGYCYNKDIYITWFGGEPLLNTGVMDYICDSLENKGVAYSKVVGLSRHFFLIS